MDGRLGLTLKQLALPGQSMSEDRVLEIYSVAEAIQLMMRNCPWMIPKLKGPGPFQVHTGVETYVNRSAEQTCLTIYSRIFSSSRGEPGSPWAIFGGLSCVPFPVTHFTFTEYLVHKYCGVSASECCQILTEHTRLPISPLGKPHSLPYLIWGHLPSFSNSTCKLTNLPYTVFHVSFSHVH